MKVSQFLAEDIDIDVVDDVTEELNIAYVGSMTLTPEGKSQFKDVLNCEVELDESIAVIKLSKYKDWEHKLEVARLLFESAAGFCSVSSYYRWFRKGM